MAIDIKVRAIDEDYDVNLPEQTTGKQIIDAFIDGGQVPATNQQGDRYDYKLTSKAKGVEIYPEQTLGEVGITPGDTLLLVAEVWAG